MNGTPAWLALLLACDTPALPQAQWMRYYLPLSWLFPLGLLGALLGRRLPWRARRLLAAVFGIAAVLAGSAFPVHWLGLAFQSLSLSSMLLSGLAFVALVSKPPAATAWPVWKDAGVGYLLVAVLPGYLLLLDTFAVLPLQIYAWGFSPLALLCLLAISLVPTLQRSVPGGWDAPQRWVVPCALLLFAATRLPTGNVWDALLDPCLWLMLNGVLVRRLYVRWRCGTALP